MTKRRILWYLFAFAAVAGVAGMTWLHATSRSIVFSIKGDDISEAPLFSLFNPFRDQSPEKVGDLFFRRLAHGEVAEALSMVATPVHPSVPERETQYPIRDWQLVNRKDAGEAVRLDYRVVRRGDLKYVLSLELRRQDKTWQIEHYIVYY